MKKITYILIFILVGIVIQPSATQSQTNKINLKNYSIESGLATSIVTDLIQDSKGFIWIASQDGLHKYDGYTFKKYRHNPLDSNSISTNTIFSICEDSNQNLWIATSFGLNFFDRKKAGFKSFLHQKDNYSSISDNTVYNVYIDKKGIVWSKTYRYLEKYDPKTQKFSHYEFYFDEFTRGSENNYDIHEDHKGNLWIATKDGVSIFDKVRDQFSHYFHHEENNEHSLSHNEVREIYQGKDSTIYIGTHKGLNIFNPETQDFTHVFYKNPDTNQAWNSIDAIYEDNNGTIWVGTQAGMLIFNKKQKKLNPLQLPQTTQRKMERISDIIQDKSNILWIATSNGLFKLNIEKPKFKLYRSGNHTLYNFTSNHIASIYQAPGTNEIWLGTWGEGLNIFNRKTNEVKHYTSHSHPELIPDDFVHVIFPDSKNNLWIGTRSGIIIYDKATKKFTTPEKKYDTREFEIFKNTRVNQIIEDHKGNIWIGSDNGLFKFNFKKLTSYYSNVEAQTKSLSSNHIYCLLEDNEHTLWIGTANGLSRFFPEQNKFKTYKKKQFSQKGLSHNTVMSLHQIHDSIIWIGTESGLNRYNKETGKFKFFTQQKGLKNDFIYSISSSNKNSLWISTNRGIAKLNLTTYFITNYDITDGLQDYEFNIGSYFKSIKGELFFGGVNGFNSFYPDSIKKNPFIPPLSVTKVERITKDGRQTIYKDQLEEIIIHHNDYMVTIHFSALEFHGPDKNQYKFKIEGRDKKFIPLYNQNFVTISQIPPGEYTLRIIGSNNDLVWNKDGISLKLTVKPSPFKSIPAYIFYILSGIIMIFFFIRSRTRNLRKANQRLKEKQRIAHEIAKQKEELSIKNTDITDSINYAKRILEALLPRQKAFRKILPESFVFFRPKDIVSGDFYWIAKKNNKIFVAAVDCTGHGVPGAFMSIIGFDLLRNITKEQGIEQASHILDKLNEGVADTFGSDKDAEESTVTDGMDIALIVINRNNNTLEYAGAHNPLYLIRENNILEYKADRFSVGLGTDKNKRFTNHIIPIKEEDMIYLFSDGFADQFGGPAQKKYKYRRFRHLLLTIHKLSMDKQKKSLEKSMDNWQGAQEQVDDMLIIGINPGALEKKLNKLNHHK